MPTYGVAVTIPDPHGAALTEARRDAGDPMAGAIPPHVTLLPPTELTDQELADFEGHLDQVAIDSGAFAMHLSGTGTFRPLSPVVFVQVSRGISSCERLESQIRSGPVRRVLEFPYHPHVTIAHHLPDDRLDGAFDALGNYRARFVVDGFDLYAQDGDGVWRPRRRFILQADARDE